MLLYSVSSTVIPDDSAAEKSVCLVTGLGDLVPSHLSVRVVGTCATDCDGAAVFIPLVGYNFLCAALQYYADSGRRCADRASWTLT